ncbi:MAG: hypothetical protein WD077_16155 [Bacteroidia bacterium]
MKQATIYIIFLFALSGCGLAYRVILGIDTTLTWKSKQEIEKDFDKQNIPAGSRYILDTATYANAIKSEFRIELKKMTDDTVTFDSVQAKLLKTVAKDDLQPVQVRYFDNSLQQIFKQVNCYIRVIPMSWNVDNSFDTFPPRISMPALNHRPKPLDYFLPHLLTLEGEPVTQENLETADYYVLIFWNSFMKRPSKKLIRTVKSNIAKNPDRKIVILYVNNYNAEIWDKLDPSQKALYKEYLESGNEIHR